jgi:hypothetical protein
MKQESRRFERWECQQRFDDPIFVPPTFTGVMGLKAAKVYGDKCVYL